MKIEEWNAIPKDEETDVIAIDGDLVTEIDGVAFLIQRKGNGNNVVCKRVSPSTTSIVRTFRTFCLWCKENNVQYIRVEGATHKYRMLELVKRICDEGANYVLHKQQTQETGHTVYYVKTY